MRYKNFLEKHEHLAHNGLSQLHHNQQNLQQIQEQLQQPATGIDGLFDGSGADDDSIWSYLIEGVVHLIHHLF